MWAAGLSARGGEGPGQETPRPRWPPCRRKALQLSFRDAACAARPRHGLGGAGRPRLGGRWRAAPPGPARPTQAGRPTGGGPTGPLPSPSLPAASGSSGYALGPPLGRGGQGAPARPRWDTSHPWASAVPLQSPGSCLYKLWGCPCNSGVHSHTPPTMLRPHRPQGPETPEPPLSQGVPPHNLRYPQIPGFPHKNQMP